LLAAVGQRDGHFGGGIPGEVVGVVMGVFFEGAGN
jgi:hypothetical protein